MLGIKELNKTLERETRIKLVDFETFKKLHQGNEKSLKLDRAVAKIDIVIKCEKGYLIKFNDGTSCGVWYSGHMNKNGNNPTRNIDTNSGRVRINNFGNIANTSMYPEKIIGICDCILRDELPITFKGLVVNVMDGSGTDEAAAELGIAYNLHEDNLEWTLNKRNMVYHGGAIRHLKEITGHVYRFSANDKALYEALELKNEAWIKHYMMMNYKKVR